MSLITPISAAILQAASFTLDKTILSFKRITHKTYLGISFPLIFIITLIIFFIFKPPLSISLFSGKFFWLLLLSIILGIITNLIFYRTLKTELLSEIQTIDLLRNIPLILLAGIIFVGERNFLNISLALIAALAIIWSHWKKHHFQIAKKILPFLIWTITIAPFGGIISKALLTIWNPISLELIRSGAMAFILGPLFLKQSKKVPSKVFLLLIVTNILTSIAWILYYFSYQISGIVFTVLIFSLQPMLVYFTSLIFLKEPIEWKKFAAFIIILVSITITQII